MSNVKPSVGKWKKKNKQTIKANIKEKSEKKIELIVKICFKLDLGIWE